MPIDHFRILAPIYDRFVKFHEKDLLFQHLLPERKGILLDAGGGTGRVSTCLSEYFAQIIVTDLSYQMLLVARSKGLGSACGNMEELPFPSEIFERILLMDALHHVDKQDECLLELWRLLKPGGRLLIVEPDIRKFAVKIIAVLEKIALMNSHFLKTAQIAGLLAGTNAKIQLDTTENTVWVIFEKPTK